MLSSGGVGKRRADLSSLVYIMFLDLVSLFCCFRCIAALHVVVDVYPARNTIIQSSECHSKAAKRGLV